MRAPDAPAKPPDTWRRRALEVFASGTYRTYFVGLLASTSGFWLRIAATGWLAYTLTGRRDRLGEITAAGLLPWVISSPLGGVLADRWNPRRFLMAVYALVVLANVGLSVLFFRGSVDYGVLLLMTVVIGFLRGLENPARQTLVRDFVALEILPNAIGMNAAAFHLTNALGFALAGVVYALGGAGACFLLAALLPLPMIVQLLRLPDGQPRSRFRGAGAFRDLREGFGYARHHGLIRRILLGSGLLVTLVLTFRALMPAVARDNLGLGVEGYGNLMALSGLGSLLAALWVAGRRAELKERIVFLFRVGVAACLGLALVAVSRSSLLTGMALFLCGFAQVAFMATANGTIQQCVTDELRGRVMGIWALLFGAGYPLGTWLLGLLAECFGLTASLLGASVVGLAAGSAFLVRIRRRPLLPA